MKLEQDNVITLKNEMNAVFKWIVNITKELR